MEPIPSLDVKHCRRECIEWIDSRLHTSVGCRQVRSIARQGTPLHPWIEPRESRWYKSGKSLFFESDLYQEMLLHMAMAGVRRYLWW